MTTSVNTTKVYDEIIDFIAAGTTPQSVIDFKLSHAAQERLEDLVYAHQTGELTPEEKRVGSVPHLRAYNEVGKSTRL